MQRVLGFGSDERVLGEARQRKDGMEGVVLIGPRVGLEEAGMLPRSEKREMKRGPFI